jgi:hypothetical protein
MMKVNHDCRGASIIELAILFPVFLLFVLGLLQLGIMLWGDELIANVINEIAQQSSYGCLGGNVDAAGNCQGGSGIDATYIENLISSRSLGLIDSTQLCFRADLLKNIVEMGSTISVPAGINLGQGGDSVMLFTSYSWPIVIPYISAAFGVQNTFVNVTLVRNQPFGSLSNVNRSSAASVAPCPATF